MRGHDSLRGFLGGEDREEPPFFAYSATLRVFAERLDLDAVTLGMGMPPSSSHRRGERRGPRSPGFPHDMWMLDSGLDEDQPLGAHIDALWSRVRSRREFLMSLKEVATVDVFLGYRSNVDTAGVEVPHTCLEMFTSLQIPFGISIIVA
jgi:hypothetical protein